MLALRFPGLFAWHFVLMALIDAAVDLFEVIKECKISVWDGRVVVVNIFFKGFLSRVFR